MFQVDRQSVIIRFVAFEKKSHYFWTGVYKNICYVEFISTILQYKPIIGGISACHSISLKIIFHVVGFSFVMFFMNYDIDDNDKICICCCLKYFKLGTTESRNFIITKLE